MTQKTKTIEYDAVIMASSLPQLLSASYDYESDLKTTINYYSLRDIGLLDDLEMELVAKLVIQQQPTSVQSQQHQLDENGGGNILGNGIRCDNGEKDSPKDNRYRGSTKKWKNWGWKYSPGGGKTSSIEEEPDSPKKSQSSKHSTPSNSPKHRQVRNNIDDSGLSSSPMRRKKNQSSPVSDNNRSSAGARLYQILDGTDNDESGDEMQTLLLSNGRPASIHVIQTTTNGSASGHF